MTFESCYAAHVCLAGLVGDIHMHNGRQCRPTDIQNAQIICIAASRIVRIRHAHMYRHSESREAIPASLLAYAKLVAPPS